MKYSLPDHGRITDGLSKNRRSLESFGPTKSHPEPPGAVRTLSVGLRRRTEPYNDRGIKCPRIWLRLGDVNISKL